MAIQPIRLFGDPVLRQRADEVVDFDKELRRLVEDLTDTMLDAPGAGLAAPQIGVGLRVFTWHVEGEVGHLVNPVLDLSEEEQDGSEGCLSIPGLSIDCRRALSVVAKGFDMYGEPVTIDGSELLARAIQHETDHLDGVLFVDRLDAEHRKIAMKLIRESEWFGLERPDGEGVAALDARAGPLVRVVFAGTPDAALPALEAVVASPHELVAVVTRPDAPVGPRPPADAVPGRRPRRGARRPRPEARAPARPGVPGRPARARAGLLPRGRLRRPAAAVGPRHPAARLGEPALLGAARLARVPRRCSTRSGPATR